MLLNEKLPHAHPDQRTVYLAQIDLNVKVKQRIDSTVVLALIAVMPVMMLTNIGHQSAAFYALALVCLSICFTRPGGIFQTFTDLAPYRWLALALSMMAVEAAIGMLYSNQILGAEFERAVRVGLGLFVVLGACLTLIPQWLRQSIWGLAAAVWSATGYAVWLSWPTFRRPEDVPEYNAVSYGNLLLMMTMLCACSLGWRLTRLRKTEMAFKVLTVIVGMVGFIATQTRSGWLAIPFFIVVGLLLAGLRLFSGKTLVAGLIALAVAVAIFTSSPIMRHRAQEGMDEFNECVANPVAVSSVCVRIQLWRASWLMFTRNPAVGNGSTGVFPVEIDKLVKAGVLSTFLVTEMDGFNEPHNDILFTMASHGLTGLIALLLLYLAPAWIFARRLLRQSPQQTRIAAGMGLAVCLGFMAFGLTELMFRRMSTMAFYAVMIGWLLALSDPRCQTDTECQVKRS